MKWGSSQSKDRIGCLGGRACAILSLNSCRVSTCHLACNSPSMVSKIHGPKKEKKKRYGFSVNKINLRVALHRNAPTRSIKLETSPHSESCISCVDIGSNQMGYLLGSLFSLLPSVPERRRGNWVTRAPCQNVDEY